MSDLWKDVIDVWESVPNTLQDTSNTVEDVFGNEISNTHGMEKAFIVTSDGREIPVLADLGTHSVYPLRSV